MSQKFHEKVTTARSTGGTSFQGSFTVPVGQNRNGGNVIPLDLMKLDA